MPEEKNLRLMPFPENAGFRRRAGQFSFDRTRCICWEASLSSLISS